MMNQSHYLLTAMIVVSLMVPIEDACASAGDHVRVGIFEVAPSLSSGFEFHSNVFYEQTDAEPGFAVFVNPKMNVVADSSSIEFGSSVQLHAKRFVGEESSRASNYNDYDLSFRIGTPETQRLGFSLEENIRRKNSPIASIGAVDPFTSHFVNQLKGLALINTGGAFELSLGGQVQYDSFLVPDGAQISGDREYGAKNSYGPELSAAWHFFPRTAIVAEASMDYIRWNENVIAAGGDFTLGQVLIVPDSDSWRVIGGLRGRITSPLVIELMAGMGSALYDENSAVVDVGAVASGDRDPSVVGFSQDLIGWDKLLVNAQIRYNSGLGRKVTLGYKRDFEDVFFTNFVTYDYGFLRVENRLGSRMGINGQGGVRLEQYSGEVDRVDVRLHANAGLMVYLQNWGALSVSGGWLQRASTDTAVEYDDFRLIVGAEFTY